MRYSDVKYGSRNEEITNRSSLKSSSRRRYVLKRRQYMNRHVHNVSRKYIVTRSSSPITSHSGSSSRSQIVNRKRKIDSLKRGTHKSKAYNGNPIDKMGGVVPGFDRKTRRKVKPFCETDSPINTKGSLKKSIFRKHADISKTGMSTINGKGPIKTGKGVSLSKKIKLRKKFGKVLDNKLKKTKSKKNARFKAVFLEKLMDSIGRDQDGSLNFIGIILAIILLIPVIGTSVAIVAISSVVIAVISVFLAIWLFFVDLFTIKTEDMALTEAYKHVTYLDASKNKEIYEKYKQLKETSDKIYFMVNGAASDPEQMMYSSDGDNYLYYLNAKYEIYDIYKKINSNSNIFGVTSIKDEIDKIHDYTFNYKVTNEVKDVEKTVISINPNTGKEEVNKVVEPQHITTMNVTVKTIQQFVDENPETLSEDAQDRYYPIQELDRFENKIFLESPLGEGNVATVIEKFGYRGRDAHTQYDFISLATKKGQPIYAVGTSSVGGIGSGGIWTYNNYKKRAYYWGLENIQVMNGQRLEKGDLIGYSNGNFSVAIKEERPFKQIFNYPTVFYNDLAFNYQSSNGYHAGSGGLTGDLLNPPSDLLIWREEVKKAAKKYGISEYENLILSIIWEESGGQAAKTPDIMQASESLGKSPNSISDPVKSIDIGTKYLASLLNKAKDLNLNEYAAIQAYNYGVEFLTWLHDKGLNYSFEIAKNYASEKSHSQIVEYNNSIAMKRGYNWRYKYGNMFYVDLITQHIMKDDNALVKVAKLEVGNSDGSRYWKWFGFNRKVEWSAIFISWIADQSNYINQGRIPKLGNIIDMVNWYKQNNKYKTTTEDYIPKVGDLIFFDWKGTKTGKDHVGIVEYSDGNIIQTIEGNSGDTVKRNTYDINNQSISGYGVTGADN